MVLLESVMGAEKYCTAHVTEKQTRVSISLAPLSLGIKCTALHILQPVRRLRGDFGPGLHWKLPFGDDIKKLASSAADHFSFGAKVGSLSSRILNFMKPICKTTVVVNLVTCFGVI
jgi:hypothetical protein